MTRSSFPFLTVLRHLDQLHIVGLCSYHAYNRCDAHGANVKKAARAEQLGGAGPTTPAEFAHMVSNLPAAEFKGITVCPLSALLHDRAYLVCDVKLRILESGTRRTTPI